MLLTLLALSWATSQADLDPQLVFERQRIGTTVYEAASAFDVDRDGHIDIVSGAYWHAGPDFQTAHKITDVPMVGDYYDDFSDYPLDVNGDGWIDIVTGGYFSESLRWLENPGAPVARTVHHVDKTGAIERCVSTTTSTAMASTRCFDHRSASGLQAGSGGRWLHEALLATEGGGGHGIGFGDVNGDGYADAVFNGGWMEGPEDPFSGEWVWHPEFDLGGSASVPILVYDVNEDGLSDLIVGGAHNYALDWWEQGMENGQRTGRATPSILTARSTTT